MAIVQASQELAEAAKHAPFVSESFKVHDFKTNAPPPDGVSVRCVTCGTEIVWEHDDEMRLLTWYRKSPSDEWQPERIPCHEQPSLFGGK